MCPPIIGHCFHCPIGGQKCFILISIILHSSTRNCNYLFPFILLSGVSQWTKERISARQSIGSEERRSFCKGVQIKEPPKKRRRRRRRCFQILLLIHSCSKLSDCPGDCSGAPLSNKNIWLLICKRCKYETIRLAIRFPALPKPISFFVLLRRVILWFIKRRCTTLMQWKIFLLPLQTIFVCP